MKTIMILCTVPDERLEMVLKEAKELDYRTVFCGEEVNEATAAESDAYYKIPWSHTEKLIHIGRKERIDGVIGLCDKAMIPVSRIAEALGLPGNSVTSMERMLSKNAFRSLQEEAGVFSPRHTIVKPGDSLQSIAADFQFPVIVKPLLSSSSFGMTVLQNRDGMEEAFQTASEQSRNGEVCFEEYIQQNSLRIIEADVFVLNDDIIWDGIRYCYRLERAPLRPCYDVYPVHLTSGENTEFRHTVAMVLKTAGVKLGEYNVEGFFTKEGRFFIVEINPRQAGHYNPQDICLYCGVNLTRLLITTACGDISYYQYLKSFSRTSNPILSYSVFSMKEGILDHIHIDDSLLPKLKAYRFLHGQKEGDRVKDIHTAVRPILKAVFQFESEAELESYRTHIEGLVYPVLANNS